MELTAEQQSAVTTESNRVLVVAGAGSGKTRVLTERVAHLTEDKQVRPVEILAFTFTRMAAQEMRDRIEKRLGIHGQRVEIGTMHGVALGLLKRFGEMVGFRPYALSVYSEWQANFLFEDCAAELGLKKGKTWKAPKKELQAALRHFEATGEMPAPMSPAYGLILSFRQRCKQNNACTYGELLTYFEQLIDLGVVTRYTSWLHVLVDEAQDLDMRQWRIVEKLCLDRSLFAVGDIRQSIYAFRGACPQYLFDRVASFDIYNLTANFRSAECVVNAANRLIARNGMVLGEDMVSAAAVEEGVVDHNVIGFDSAMLADILAHRCWQEKVVVLSRVHGLLGKLSRELEARGIKPLYVGQQTATTRSEGFARVHALVHLMANAYDNFSFLIAKDLLGLSHDEYKAIRTEAAEVGESHFNVWRSNFGVTDYPGNEASIVAATLYVLTILKLDAVQSEDLAASLAFMQAVSERFPTMTVSTYIDYLATLDVQDELPSVEDFPQVTLMTVHASKGLEFENVIVWGANEGIFPDKRSMSDRDELEGERRLAYVAITRAIRRLVFVSRPEDDKTGGPSRFIVEALG